MILGMNGYIWIQAPVEHAKSTDDSSMVEDERGEASASKAIYSSQNDLMSATVRANIDRVAVCVRILAARWIPITDSNVMEAYNASLELRGEDGEELEMDQLLREEVQASIVAATIAANI